MDTSEHAPDRSISTRTANILAVPLFLAALVLAAALFALAHQRLPYRGLDTLLGLEWPLLVGLLAASILAHELLHGAAFNLLGRVRWREIRIGVHWRVLTPFASTAAPMPARAYRAAIVAPGTVLGMLPILLATMLQLEPLLWYGAFMLGMAAGDALALWAMRGVPAGALVVDRPDRVGCSVMT